MTLADRLDKAMKNRGASAYKIEQDINISRALIGKYLKGTEPSVNNILLLSDYLKVPLDWPIRGEGSMLKEQTETKESDSPQSNDVIELLKEQLKEEREKSDLLTKYVGKLENILDQNGINYNGVFENLKKGAS